LKQQLAFCLHFSETAACSLLAFFGIHGYLFQHRFFIGITVLADEQVLFGLAFDLSFLDVCSKLC
jgi:hypothetical protein